MFPFIGCRPMCMTSGANVRKQGVGVMSQGCVVIHDQLCLFAIGFEG